MEFPHRRALFGTPGRGRVGVHCLQVEARTECATFAPQEHHRGGVIATGREHGVTQFGAERLDKRVPPLRPVQDDLGIAIVD